MSEKSPTDNLSPSRIKMWLSDCQQKWAFIYVHGKKRPPAAALAFGNAWDEAISDKEGGYWSETLKRRHPSASDLADNFAARFKEKAEEIEYWGEDDRDSMVDTGTNGAKLWTPSVGEKHYPVSLQRGFQFGLRAPNGDSFSLNGKIDTALRPLGDIFGEEGALLHDDKTSKRSWYSKGKPGKEVTSSLQKAAYTLGALVDDELKGQVNPHRFVFDVLVKTKTPKFESFVVDVTKKEQDAYLKLAVAVREQINGSIRAGTFIPNRASNMCSRRWCPFWEDCEKEHGGKVTQ